MSGAGKVAWVPSLCLGLILLGGCGDDSDAAPVPRNPGPTDQSDGGDRCHPDPCEGKSGRVCEPASGACVCAHLCDTEGAGQCSEGRARTCVADAEGCRAWSEQTDCPSGRCADEQSCEKPCVDACTKGVAECDAARVRVCNEQNPGCTVWSDWTNCGSGFCADTTTCGNCGNVCAASATECVDGQLRSCLPKENGCLDWSNWSACPSGFCADGAACGECAHACATVGEVSCADGRLRTCELDEKGCRRFAEQMTPCPGGVCADTALCGFTVGGVVTGLIGAVVLDLGGEQLSITANGTFQFLPRVDGARYAVAIAQHPAEQQCSVAGGVGAIAGSNVSNIRVACDGEPLGNLQEIAYIKASNTGASDSFGSVAIDGDTLVVGAPGEDSDASGINGADNDARSASGAVYVFARSGDGWAQQAYIKASNPDSNDGFGGAVALVGDTLAVGAVREASAAVGIGGDQSNNQLSGAGAVYVFVRQGTTWTQQAYIKASNTGASDNFGYAVALTGEGNWFSSDSSGDLLAVGALGERSRATGIDGDQADNSAPLAGAVYVFRRQGTTWTQDAYIKASNAEPSDTFGASVALSGDTLAVGAPFEAGGKSGVNPDPTDNTALAAGAAYVFRRSGGKWAQDAYLKASNTEARDGFGITLALSGDLLAVGAAYEGSSARGVNADQADNGAAKAGAVYVFRRDRTAWQQEAYLKASNTGMDDNFGLRLALSGTTLVVGAAGEDSAGKGPFADQSDNKADFAGAAYVFDRGQDAIWRQAAYLKAPNAQAGDRFGTTVAISGNTVFAAAPQEDSAATGVGGDPNNEAASNSGAAYAFQHCPAASATCFPCNHTCPWDGATECTGSALRTCKADANGCLAWGAAAACADGFCEDKVRCGRCPFHCTNGAAVCHGGRAGTCSVAANVCFDIAGPSTCAHGLCFDSATCANVVKVQWGSSAADSASDSAIDGAGNLFVVGSTSGNMEGTNLGSADAFLTKLDATGTILWTRQWGGDADDLAGGVAVDRDGNVYVAGTTGGSVDGQTSAGSDDLFVTKWTNDGMKLWTRQWGTARLEGDILGGMAVTGDNSLVVTGQTVGALDGNVPVGSWDVFATKLDTNGARLWTTQWGTTAWDEGDSIACAADGNIYVTGLTEGALDGNPRFGQRDAFLTKLDSTGVKQWSFQWGTNGHDVGFDVTVDNQGNVYTTGSVDGTLDGMSGFGKGDVFWMKWTPSGTRVWTRLLGTAEWDYGAGVAIAANGDPLLVASTAGALAGPLVGGTDMAFFRGTPDGRDRVSMQWGTAEMDTLSAISVGPTGVIYLVGSTDGSMNGSAQFGETDAFVFIIRP